MTDSDQLSWALSHILELEEALEEANDVIRRFREGCPTDWQVAEDGSL